MSARKDRRRIIALLNHQNALLAEIHAGLCLTNPVDMRDAMHDLNSALLGATYYPRSLKPGARASY